VIVAVLREVEVGERRVALVPDGVQVLTKAGFELRVESGAGDAAGFADAEYEAAGARALGGAALREGTDVFLKVQPPADPEIAALPSGSALVALLRPLDEPSRAARLAERGVTAFALELVPRITRAQAMDVLSSQATVAGYRAVILAAERLPKMFPLLTTAAGTLAAARVFVIGAGVAGLQAIATARRLGAVVEAYDTRPAVAEQVRSLGAKFVELPLEAGEAEDQGGYARAQSDEFYARQRALMAERAARSDVVISTALVPGQRAPLLLEEEGVKGMRAGSVVVDLAAPNGGNCASTVPGETVVRHRVTVIGETNLPSALARDASQMFSKNVVALLRHLAKDGALQVDLDDEITRGTLLTRGGQVVHEAVKGRLG
jgi:proton-translocating NAD(P)+ transhydrogenase subunit alpha